MIKSYLIMLMRRLLLSFVLVLDVLDAVLLQDASHLDSATKTYINILFTKSVQIVLTSYKKVVFERLIIVCAVERLFRNISARNIEIRPRKLFP